ncbi:MAG: hypothetical protein K0S07_735 [Chlamydiales bacterium]|jgi:hypothetical protein|nr:hypothetical protein [Chlamydiales bacterium]
MRAIATCAASPESNGLSFLELSFNIYREIGKEEIRFILLDSAQEFLNIINKKKELVAYEFNHPLTIDNISVELYFHNEDGRSIAHPGIGMAALEDSGLIYKTLGERYGYKDTFRESFEDALKIVEGSGAIERGAEK